jgi:hypothetical protein
MLNNDLLNNINVTTEEGLARFNKHLVKLRGNLPVRVMPCVREIDSVDTQGNTIKLTEYFIHINQPFIIECSKNSKNSLHVDNMVQVNCKDDIDLLHDCMSSIIACGSQGLIFKEGFDNIVNTEESDGDLMIIIGSEQFPDYL